MSTFVVKRNGVEVAKFRAPKCERIGTNKFAWRLSDGADGLIGSIYFTADRAMTIEEVTNGPEATTDQGAKDAVLRGTSMPGAESSD